MKSPAFPVNNGKRICFKCKIEKSVENYYLTRDGRRQSTCFDCERTRQRLAYQNSQEFRDRKRVYHKNRYSDLQERERQQQVRAVYHKKFAQELKDRANKKNTNSKRKAVIYLGGKCICCGYDKCDAALDFHHINPEEKEEKAAVIIRRPWSLALVELDKCALVCCRCHREIHAGITALPPRRSVPSIMVVDD